MQGAQSGKEQREQGAGPSRGQRAKQGARLSRELGAERAEGRVAILAHLTHSAWTPAYPQCPRVIRLCIFRGLKQWYWQLCFRWSMWHLQYLHLIVGHLAGDNTCFLPLPARADGFGWVRWGGWARPGVSRWERKGDRRGTSLHQPHLSSLPHFGQGLITATDRMVISGAQNLIADTVTQEHNGRHTEATHCHPAHTFRCPLHPLSPSVLAACLPPNPCTSATPAHRARWSSL